MMGGAAKAKSGSGVQRGSGVAGGRALASRPDVCNPEPGVGSREVQNRMLTELRTAAFQGLTRERGARRSARQRELRSLRGHPVQLCEAARGAEATRTTVWRHASNFHVDLTFCRQAQLADRLFESSSSQSAWGRRGKDCQIREFEARNCS